MGWLAAQGAIMAIGLFIGLVCSVIGLFFGHIILFDSIALGIAARSMLQSVHRNSSGAVPCDRHCNISAAVVAAKYQHRLLARRRTAHADLCSGVRAAGLLHFGA